jgi:hypothetical protein
MTRVLLAQFADAERLVAAARSASRHNCRLLDVFVPFPIKEIDELLDPRPSRIRVVMAIGGLTMAALAYGIEYYSAVLNYPYNAGGRPLDAWPAFMLVPFATGILLASICGLATFLYETGLPRLHHPLFDCGGFDRVSQDAFALALLHPQTAEERDKAMAWLRRAGAGIIDEANL